MCVHCVTKQNVFIIVGHCQKLFESRRSKSFSFFLYVLIFCLLVTSVYFPCHSMLNQNGSPFFSYVSFPFYLSVSHYQVISGRLRKCFLNFCLRCRNNSPSVRLHKDRLNRIWMEHKSRNLWWFLHPNWEKKSCSLNLQIIRECEKRGFFIGLA